MNGFINLNKESGISSAAAVAKIKRLFNRACGHMGTLDPMASGVLPVGIGKATRLFDYLTTKRKTYIAEFTFGIDTDTLDTTGKILYRNDKKITATDIDKVLGNFIGEINQLPPKYSAKNVNGRRGYELARAGVDFVLQPKKVEVYRFECLKQSGDNIFKFEIECGGGTYIRSLARDLAAMVETVAVMSSLVRTQSGVFELKDAITYEELAASDNIHKYIIAADKTLSFPTIELSELSEYKLLNGQRTEIEEKDGVYKVYSKDSFLGVGRVENNVVKLTAYLKD